MVVAKIHRTDSPRQPDGQAGVDVRPPASHGCERVRYSLSGVSTMDNAAAVLLLLVPAVPLPTTEDT